MTGEQFLKEHNISEEFATAQGITWDDDYLYFPIKDYEGNLLWNKPRNLHHKEEGHPLANESKYKNVFGSNTDTLFNWYSVKDKPSIVFCEGEADAMKLTEEGIHAVSSSGGAGTFNNDWAELLKDKKLWLCFDNDPAGEAAVRKMFDIFPTAKSIELPKGTKDICDFFVAGNTKKDFIQLGKESVGSGEWQKLHRLPEFDLISAGDLELMEFTEEPWIIENVIYSQGFAFIYGAEGTGKSLLTLDMAKAIITGEPWLGKFPTTKTNILFIDKENPHPMNQRRLAGMGITKEKLGEIAENVHWLKSPEKYQLTDFNGEATEFAKELSQIILEKDIGLIVIDSFVDLITGNENLSGDTQAFFDGIRELYPQIAYATLHHENKPSQGASRSASQRLRGSSNINAQAITMFRLEESRRATDELLVTQVKAKDSQKLPKFQIKMKIKPNLSGGTTVTGFEYMGEVDDSAEIDSTKSEEIKMSILNSIAERKFISRQDLLSMNLGKKATIDRVIKSLSESGEITKRKEGRQTIYTTDMFSSTDYEGILEELGTPL